MSVTISGRTSGNVQKDEPTETSVTGQLTASDTSSGAAITWSILGGTAPHSPNYQFAIDQFQVVKGGSTIFNDTFTSLTPPSFVNGHAAQYKISGGTLANNGHQDILAGSNAGALNASTGTDGQIAVLNTDPSSDPTTGLKSGTSFTTAGTFDLVLPSDARYAYGIELSDGGAGDGHDQVRLEVVHNNAGAIQVHLMQVNAVTGANTVLQAIDLAPGPNDDQIELQLSNNGSVNNGQVTASFTLLNHGVIDSTTTFTATGSIFLGENGQAENWTQPGFFAFAPHLSDSMLQGTYGTIDVTQSGAWTYGLASSQANVQALTSNDTRSESSFTVQARDSQGASATTAVSISVFGNNPTLAVEVTGAAGLGHPAQGAQAFSQFLAFGDSAIDSGYFLTHPISPDSSKQSQYDLSAAAGGGIPTSIGGLINSQILASDYGLTAIPVGKAGGTNYAASGATVLGSLNGSLAPTIDSQIKSYLASVNNIADPNALYLISGGGNDVKQAEELDPLSGQNLLISHANTLAADIAQLEADGARYIVLRDATRAEDAALGVGTLFPSTFLSDLAASGVQIIAANVGDLEGKMEANPASYGIVNADRPPEGPFTATSPYNTANGGADLNPNPAKFPVAWALYATQLVSPNAGQTNLWADNTHLAAAGQQIEADYLHSLIQNAVPVLGETLTANPVLTASNGSTSNVSYQWQRLVGQDQTQWHDISGATGSTYVVQQADDGARLRVEAFFTDPATAQSLSATSLETFPIVVPPLITAGQIQAEDFAITRTTLPLDQATSIASSINSGAQTEAQFINSLLSQVADTTIPAVAVEASMYGAVGTSAEVTLLATQFLPAQVANAIQNGFNPQVYASEALGLVFAFGNENGGMAFATNFGPSNAAMPATTAGDAAFAAAAASAIFGSAETVNTPGAIGGFVSNWKAFYTSNGIPGIPNPTADQIDLAARGAAWGDAVGVALANNLGPLNTQAINFLEDAAQGTAIYSASLSSQPNHAPFQGAATASVASAANDVQLTGVAATSDHIWDIAPILHVMAGLM
jgi:VCBS repeat-containing protein